jgi:hypothetical protein
MEFELGSGTEATVEGNVDIELPDYVTMLPREELLEAKRASQRNEMIIAAGRHPESGDIVALTGDGKLLQMRRGFDGIPDGPVIPIDFGHGVAIETGTGYFEMASDWFVHNSQTILAPG